MTRPLNPSLLLVILAVALATARGADDPPPSFAQLQLLSGRKLKNVFFRAYDAKTEKLLIVADGKAMVIPIADVPATLHQQIKAGTRPSGETVTTLTTPTPPPTRHSRTRPAPVVSPSPAVRPPENAPGRTNTRDPAQLALSRHRQAAQRHAERYYAFEYQLGSNAGKVTALDFDMTTPKPVPGWEGRFETQGKASLEYFDARGRSFRRITSTFEVLTEQRHGEELKVITLNVKS